MRFAQITATASIALLAVIASAGAASTAWHEPGTPQGGYVMALERGADGTMYAGTLAGLFTSPDGVTWRRGGEFPGVNDDAGVTAVVAPFAATAYAVAGGSLFKSTDDGASWRRSDVGIPAGTEVASIAATRARPDVIYAGTRTGFVPGVYRSDNGGESWSRTAYGLDEGAVPYVLAVDPTAANTVYVGTANGEAPDETGQVRQDQSGGVYRTADGGASWTQLSIGLPRDTAVVSLTVDPAAQGTIYAGTEGHGVFKSGDGGLRWRAARSGLPKQGGSYGTVTGLVVDPTQREVVYAATSMGAATSTDGGSSWRSQTVAGAPELSALVADDAPGTLFAASLDRGVLRSTDRGEHWQSANAGLTAVLATAIVADPANAAVVYLGTFESGLVRSTDAGRTWSSAGVTPHTVRAVVIDPKAARTLYIGTADDGVLKSLDGGTTWKAANRGLEEDIDALVLDPRRPRIVYAATYGSIYKSVNGGSRWQDVTESLQLWVSAIAIDPSRPALLYAADEDESRAVVASSDGGKTWKSIATGLRRGAGARALAISRAGVAFAALNRINEYGLNGDVADGVYRRERTGKRWIRIAAGLPRAADGTLSGLRSLAVNPRTGVAYVGTNAGLYRLTRTNGAWLWRLADPMFTDRTVRRLAFAGDGSRLYAATPGRFLASG